MAPIEGHPATRHVFSVDHDSKQMECLTCSLLANECSFYDATLSPDQTWIELKCLGPDVPKTILTVSNFDQSSGERRPMIKIPADDELLKQINKLKVAHKEFMKVDGEFNQKYHHYSTCFAMLNPRKPFSNNRVHVFEIQKGFANKRETIVKRCIFCSNQRWIKQVRAFWGGPVSGRVRI